ncbi:MAG: hypothetical protein IPN22_06070 [Bacteroidetes bacterium]|nr:hypothetical protein [Bacteroidota bacterium]
MKKIAVVLVASILATFTVQEIQAQAWEKETKVISINVGGANYFHVGRIYNGSIYKLYYLLLPVNCWSRASLSI